MRQVYLDKPCRALGEVLEELLKADIIVMGPGSLYTSVLPNFCVQDLCDAIRASRAVKIYACNIMTQPGETLGYKASDHVRAVLEHCGRGIVNNVLVNDNMEVPAYLLERYQKEGAALVKPDRGALEKLGVRVFGADLVDARSDTIRHSAMQLGQSVMDIYRQVRFIDSVIHHKTYGP